jgi:hypothetical protein
VSGSWAAVRPRGAEGPQHFQYPTTCCTAAHRGFVPIGDIRPWTLQSMEPAGWCGFSESRALNEASGRWQQSSTSVIEYKSMRGRQSL